MSALVFPFTLNERPASAAVHTPEAISLNMGSYGVGLTVVFTVAEAKAAAEALTKACEAAEQIAMTLATTGGTA